MRAITLIWIVFLTACTPRAVREAESVVAQADSLRAEGRVYGIDAGDSATLAQAYETLSIFNSPLLSTLNPQLSTVFSHSCYHYGRLLREKDNPVEAMQVFINATHSRTHDYHILGRVYSNMGEIVHLADDFPLSYDMFERSADMFLQSGDTTAYYYALNDMAFELAEQGKKEEAYTILTSIDQNYYNYDLSVKMLETRANACKQVQQYDSAAYYTIKLYNSGNHEATALMFRAQAYSFMGLKDSAVYYAKQVIAVTKSPYDINNALYILTNDDESKDKSAIRETAANRSDMQKLIDIRHSKLSQAVQLLELDLNKKPNLTWLYVIITTALLTGGGFYWRYMVHKRQMQTHVVQLIEKQANSITKSIKQHIDKNNIAETLHWKQYASMKVDVDLFMGGIASKLEAKNLNETEIRFCILTMLDFSQKEIAETIHYSYPSGIKTLKKRISVKIGTTPQNLRDFLFQS